MQLVSELARNLFLTTCDQTTTHILDMDAAEGLISKLDRLKDVLADPGSTPYDIAERWGDVFKTVESADIFSDERPNRKKSTRWAETLGSRLPQTLAGGLYQTLSRAASNSTLDPEAEYQYRGSIEQAMQCMVFCFTFLKVVENRASPGIEEHLREGCRHLAQDIMPLLERWWSIYARLTVKILKDGALSRCGRTWIKLVNFAGYCQYPGNLVSTQYWCVICPEGFRWTCISERLLGL